MRGELRVTGQWAVSGSVPKGCTLPWIPEIQQLYPRGHNLENFTRSSGKKEVASVQSLGGVTAGLIDFFGSWTGGSVRRSQFSEYFHVCSVSHAKSWDTTSAIRVPEVKNEITGAWVDTISLVITSFSGFPCEGNGRENDRAPRENGATERELRLNQSVATSA